MPYRLRLLIWFLFAMRGRVGRIGFWGFHLTVLALAVLLMILSYLTYDPLAFMNSQYSAMRILLLQSLLSYSLIAVTFIVVLCSFAVTAKRWHDRDKSGWWVLMGFVPVVGTIWMLVECGCLKGTDGGNRFGPDPLGPDFASVFN